MKNKKGKKIKEGRKEEKVGGILYEGKRNKY